MGALLVERKIVTSEQLEEALLLQEERGGLIGEILVATFGVSRIEIAGVLAEQWADLGKAVKAERAASEPAPEPVAALVPPEVRLRRPLGQILIEYGFVSEQQLEAALAAQTTSGARLGEILIEQGVLTRIDLASALGEQWSPTPVASQWAAPDRGPSLGSAPATAEPVPGWSEDDRAVVADLEQRLLVIERSAGGMPWQEDLRLVTFDLRAAISNVERRIEAAEGAASTELSGALDAVSTRIEALESASLTTELEAVRHELEEQKTRPVTVAGLDEIRTAIGRLEERPDRADEISQLAREVSVLAARLDQLSDTGELREKLETIAGQTEAAQAGFAGLELRSSELAALESRLDAVAERVPDAGLIGELAKRLDEVAASNPGIDTVDLTARIDALEQDGRAGSTALERLAAELGQLGGRTQEQLAELASLGPDPAPWRSCGRGSRSWRRRATGSGCVVARRAAGQLDDACRVVEPDMAP